MRKKVKIILISTVFITASSIGITFGIIYYINSPSARYGYGMVYDENINKIILFGGGYQDSNTYTSFDDTWIFDPIMNLWSQVFPQNHPSARNSHSMVYDSVNKKIILFGGMDMVEGWKSDTWIYDSVENSWTQVFPDNSPARRGSASVFYDPVSQNVILYGGYRQVGGHLDDTWAYNYVENNWTNLNPSLKPTGRYGATMVYDPINERGFMFGGRITSVTNESWIYYPTNNTWLDLNLSTNPPSRYWHGLVYDGFSQKVVLFGGSSGTTGPLDDTWTYNPINNQWFQESPNISPVGRIFFTLVYAIASRNTILFGGSESGQRCYGDTWAFGYHSHHWIKIK